MKRIKAGIIGMGFIGPIHLEALRRLGSIDVCIATSSEATVREAARKYGVDEFYDNWEDLLACPDLDVVHICAPNQLHFPIALRAMQLGKHVICDKPLTLDIAEARELTRVAAEVGVVNAVTFNTAYYPLITQASQLIKSGQLGRINYVQGYYLQDWLMRSSDYNWRVEAALGGSSRVVGDIGSHCLFMLQKVIGQKIDSLLADFNCFVPIREKPEGAVRTYAAKDDSQIFRPLKVDTEDQATLLLEFDQGAKGVFVGGQAFAGHKNKLGFEIYGSERSLAWNAESPNELWIGERQEANRTLMKDFNLLVPDAAAQCDFAGGWREGLVETWKNLFRQIYAAIRTGCHQEGVYPSFADGLQMQSVVNASFDSSQKRQWIQVLD